MRANKILKIFLAYCACIGLLHCQREALAPVNLSVMSSADDSAVPDSVRDVYYEDAARLALRELDKNGDLADAPVELPGELVDSFYQALILVYNAVALPARHAVVEQYNIHTFRWPESYRLAIGVDSTQAWVQALRRGESFTGDPQVDFLLQDFGLRFGSYEQRKKLLVLLAQKPLNMAALAKRFAALSGVYHAEPYDPVLVALDGGDIGATFEGEILNLYYKLGWGDCPSGCLHGHSWHFRIHSNNLVEFAGEWGDQLP